MVVTLVHFLNILYEYIYLATYWVCKVMCIYYRYYSYCTAVQLQILINKTMEFNYRKAKIFFFKLLKRQIDYIFQKKLTVKSIQAIMIENFHFMPSVNSLFFQLNWSCNHNFLLSWFLVIIISITGHVIMSSRFSLTCIFAFL